MIQGVQIDLISAERLDKLTMMEKIHLILDEVMEGNIVVLEKGLAPEEQSKLIEVTMREISPDGFAGIEMETYPVKEAQGGFLGKLFGGRRPETRLTVIGPANQLKTLRKDKDLISAWVSSSR
ncbi:DUF2073 domain-containing protein [Methanoculleus receptaculi]|uniref:DUF2073 domain-containing protein n=1 Tax=Methanoculleus receptaculi TaxID=394967 RepID=A0AAX4FU95_9EURY|nr:DUF2073 domain-containing protein [Methanoculleus receptaculi]WOX57355.1 DUF2073 domain-containing protein [Methanoculleus receptaculi]